MSRKERLKVYHGIPKSVSDSNTLFYCDYDGSIIPKVNNMFMISSNPTTVKYSSSPTGYGMRFDENISDKALNFVLPKALTLDMWVNCAELINSGSFLTFADSSTGLRKIFMNVQKNSVAILLFGDDGDGTTASSPANSIILTSTPTSGYHHFRLTIDLINKIGSIYQDGVLKITKTVNGGNFVGHSTKVRLFSGCGNNNDDMYYFRNVTIADLHISNIDRGDYFPNLPQDFIDGKATIQPKIGQQQVKGDPFYSQETTDIVKIGNNVNPPQITCSRTSGNWTSGDTIKLVGLNKEVISGIIDTDTALCKCTKNSGTTTTLIYVDDVSKLVVGDVVEVYHVSTGYGSGNKLTITNIDTTNKIITLNNSTIYFEGDIVTETTTSTSSPIVKTSDGTVVNGTWSGLGTNNEALFTLDTNSNLTNQDLYITYSLNIPNGNSDFTELPYNVTKVYDEVGNELKEVTSVLIEDNFKGKVSGSFKECPHIIKFGSNINTLLLPNNFTSEHTTLGYKSVSTQDDSDLLYKSTNTLNDRPQQMFSFNLIEIVERKIGTIPVLDKISWLNNNLDKIVFKWTGRAECPNGYKVFIAPYRIDQSAWDTYWVSQLRHNSNSIIKDLLHVLPYRDTSNGLNYIKPSLDQNGYVHFIAFTDVSNGVNYSTIYTDYVSLEVTMKGDTNFSFYYSDNKMAREFPCNPVLIQKETKTVKRLIPSNKCFSTEVKYLKDDSKCSSNVPIVGNVKYKLIGLSTGKYNRTPYKVGLLPSYNWFNIPNISPSVDDVSPQNLMTTNIFSVHWLTNNGSGWVFEPHSEIPRYTWLKPDNDTMGGFCDSNFIPYIYGNSKENNTIKQPMLAYCLIKHNNELKIYMVLTSNNRPNFYCYGDSVKFIKLPNRPLIK